VGTDTAKDTLLAHGIKVPVPPGGPGALHFSSALDVAFYQQLTAESPERVMHGGRTAMVWRKADRDAPNEALDLMVYQLGCAVAMVTHYYADIRAMAEARTTPKPAVEQPLPPIAKPSGSWLPKRSGGWMR
jgi:phage terminase large subunit GpA-like protein